MVLNQGIAGFPRQRCLCVALQVNKHTQYIFTLMSMLSLKTSRPGGMDMKKNSFQTSENSPRCSCGVLELCKNGANNFQVTQERNLGKNRTYELVWASSPRVQEGLWVQVVHSWAVEHTDYSHTGFKGQKCCLGILWLPENPSSRKWQCALPPDHLPSSLVESQWHWPICVVWPQAGCRAWMASGPTWPTMGCPCAGNNLSGSPAYKIDYRDNCGVTLLVRGFALLLWGTLGKLCTPSMSQLSHAQHGDNTQTHFTRSTGGFNQLLHGKCLEQYLAESKYLTLLLLAHPSKRQELLGRSFKNFFLSEENPNFSLS